MKKEIINKIIRCLLITAGIYLATLTGAACKLADGAYIHIGDAAVYLAAAFLPIYIAVPVTVIGCALADFSLGSVNYVLATIVIKMLTVVAVKLFIKLSDNAFTQDLLACLAGFVTIGGYYVADVISALVSGKVFISAMSGAVTPLMFNVIQALLCAVVYMIVSPLVRIFVTKKANNVQTDNVQNEAEQQIEIE